jgi:hypothetical protein
VCEQPASSYIGRAAWSLLSGSRAPFARPLAHRCDERVRSGLSPRLAPSVVYVGVQGRCVLVRDHTAEELRWPSANVPSKGCPRGCPLVRLAALAACVRPALLQIKPIARGDDRAVAVPDRSCLSARHGFTLIPAKRSSLAVRAEVSAVGPSRPELRSVEHRKARSCCAHVRLFARVRALARWLALASRGVCRG